MMVPRSDYLHHEEIYSQDPNMLGWNSADVDVEVLSLVAELLTIADCNPPANILEIGSGMGNISIPLAQAGYDVVGIDVSPTAVATATQRAATASHTVFRVGDVTSPATYDNLAGFDCVLDGLCLHCIIGPDRGVLLRLIRKTLRFGGHFIVMTMCGDPCTDTLQARFEPESRYIISHSVAKRYLGQPEDLLREINSAGFDLTYHRIVQATSRDSQQMLLAVASVPKKG